MKQGAPESDAAREPVLSRRSRALMEPAFEGFCLLSAEGAVLESSPALTALVGWSSPELAGQDVRALIYPEDRATARELFRQTVQRPGETFPALLRFRHKDGRWRWLEVRGTNLLADPGVGAIVVHCRDVTEQRAAEAAAEANARRLCFLLAETPAMLYVLAPGNPPKVEFVSDNVRLLLGYDPAEVLAEPDFWDRHVHPDDGPAIRGQMAGVAQQQAVTFEYRFRHKNGAWRWLRDQMHVVRAAGGQPAELLGCVTDITERKQAEAALNTARERLEFLLASVPAVLYAAKPEAPFATTFISETVRPLLGYEPADFLGDPDFWLGHVHPADRETVRRACQNAVSRWHGVFEYRFRDRQGRYRWLRDEVRLRRDAQGRPRELLGCRVDLTERRQAEQALRRSEERYRTMVEGAHEGIWLTDRHWRLTFVNARLAQMFGYAPEEMLGRPITDFMDAQERAAAPAHMRAREQGLRTTHDSKFRRKDGSELWTLVSGNPLFDEHGRFAGALALLTDITERKQAERTLQRYADDLQSLAQRLLEVQEAERRVLARELHDQLGQQLTSLGLLLDRCAQADPTAARTELDRAREAVNELLQSVRRLSLELRPSMLDDLGLLPALLWQFEQYSARTAVQVQFTQSGLEGRRFGPAVETAAYRLVQEALTNVARHAGVSQVTVRVSADTAWLRVQVQDTGRGFDPAAVLATGCSNGLRGMQERASLLGGRLVFNSDPGTGTFVLAELPLGQSAPAGPAADRAASPTALPSTEA